MPNSLKHLISIIDSDQFQKSFCSWSISLADLIRETKHNSKLITLFGNGGSAADSQHWAAELMCSFRDRTREPIPAIALTTDTSVLTAWSNDFEFSTVFSRQIDALAQSNGLSIGMSTSGKSKNVLSALTSAHLHGAKTILISGSSVSESPDFDMHIILPSSDTPTIQTLTQMLYHEVCQNLENL